MKQEVKSQVWGQVQGQIVGSKSDPMLEVRSEDLVLNLRLGLKIKKASNWKIEEKISLYIW